MMSIEKSEPVLVGVVIRDLINRGVVLPNLKHISHEYHKKKEESQLYNS